jgi:hypothetical protein
MLQGTFETLSLPEVLGLLAGARKTGALYLDAGEVSGLVHLADGHCHAADSRAQHGALSDGGDLLLRVVDLCFTSMCQPSGSFRFVADEPAPWSCPEPVELSDALVEVDRLLKQWREIVRVIPSLECRPCLLETLEVEELVLDHERWTLLVAIDGRRTVREIVQRTQRPVMDVCQAMLELVEAGALGMIDPAAARASEITELEAVVAAEAAPAPSESVASPPPVVVTEAEPAPEAEPVPEAVAPVLKIVPEAAPEATAAPEADPPAEPDVPDVPEVPEAVLDEPDDRRVNEATGSEGPDRGAFLRLFSGLRES